jgi:2,3-dihydroxybenzoate-AMP ligase
VQQRTAAGTAAQTSLPEEIDAVLAGCTPWPLDIAKTYRDLGHWQGITLTGLLARAIRRAQDKTALVHGGERISYRALGDTVDRLACGFLDAGIRALDRVVVQLPNIPEFVYTYFALVRIGAIPVTALRAHRHTEVAHFLRSFGRRRVRHPRLRSRASTTGAMARELAPKAPALRAVFVVGEPARGQHDMSTLLATRADADLLSAVRVDPAEVTTMLLSGGTTSLSKLIPRTHEDYVLNARLCGAAAGFDESTVLMAILPLGHNYNLASPGMLGAFYYGGTVVLAPSGDGRRRVQASSSASA